MNFEMKFEKNLFVGKKCQFSYLLEKKIWYYIYLFVCENAYLLVFRKY